MMSAFDKVIGYESIKSELLQICDMIHNRLIYEKLGARLPKGVLLYGNPGLGKTLIARCFVEETGVQTYTIRRNVGGESFIQLIHDTFRTARENAPAIVFLDDLDKFANEDEEHRNAEEYVAVQAGIDSVRETEVFIIATVNDEWKLPDSLTRAGRFDRKIEMYRPTSKDAALIIQHYLGTKKVSPDVNMEDLAMMMTYGSCAELETILNDAAIHAAYLREDFITMKHLVHAVLRMQYESPDNDAKIGADDLRKIALHEAGHLVVCEVICPGSVGLASIRSSGHDSTGGFIHRCKELRRRPYHILVSLAGKAAVELYHSETCASGCCNDIERASRHIRKAISESGTSGFGMIDISGGRFPDASENLTARNEAVVHSELERYMFMTRNILLKNRDFLEKTAEALLQKETLLYSDIRAIRNSVDITEVAV